MLKILGLLMVALLSVAAAGVAPAGAESVQYNPNPEPTTTAVTPPAVDEGHGAPGPSGPIVKTGADSLTWVGRGLALVLVGFGIILVRRRRDFRASLR